MSIFFHRFGIRIKKKNVLLLSRLFHKDSRAEQLSFSEQVKERSEKIYLDEYQEVKKLQLPANVRNLENSEKTGFSNERTRDISSTCITSLSSASDGKEMDDSDLCDCDVRSEKCNCLASVSLSSSMQTNVSYPFHAKDKMAHLNMPGGQFMQEAKYTSEQLHNFHPANNSIKTGFAASKLEKARTLPPTMDPGSDVLSHLPKRFFSIEVKGPEEKDVGNNNLEQNMKLTRRQRLKAAFKEYGATVVVLHITLSLASLAICYALISSGMDLEAIVKDWGWSDGASTAGTVGPFLVAYAVHKVLAPMRISLSLFITPFVVHYLRKKGFKLQRKRKQRVSEDQP